MKFRSPSKAKKDANAGENHRISLADAQSLGTASNKGRDTPKNLHLSVSSLPSRKHQSLEKTTSSKSLIKRLDGNEVDQNQSAKEFFSFNQKKNSVQMQSLDEET